ncbi:helix-turn-helix domain-containing protein [Dysosmobacter sp.]
MEFHEKLQELRKQKNLTQEQLAQALFVSRTAISKWESGRGWPSIDSLKAIAAYFSVSIDDLLSGGELIGLAEIDARRKIQRQRTLVFGLLDCASSLFLFLPLFAQRENGFIRQISLLALEPAHWQVKGVCLTLVLLTTLLGVGTLVLQNGAGPRRTRWSAAGSAALSAAAVLLFMAMLEPYAAALAFLLLLIKGVLLGRRP